ncbi:MAG: zinc ribbon domain-containing protein [Campylobacteraceae bacterium]
MNKYVEQLVKLSDINKEIDAFTPRQQKIEKSKEAAREKIDGTQKKIDDLKREIDEAKEKKQKNESHLAELSEKLKSIGKKSGVVKNDKEAKALQLEEDIAKEQCDFANEDIARLEKIIAIKDEDIKKAKVELDEFIKAEETLVVELKTESDAIEKEMANVYKKKDALVSSMSQKILTFYEKIRKWAGNSAVVPVRKQACYGCFMRINDKTNALVVQSEDIITCPHCGRILFKEISSAQES